MSWNARLSRSFESRLRKWTLSVGHADLTASSNGAAQEFILGTMPAGGIVVGRAVKITTYFTGGSASAVTLEIGVAASGDIDSIMAQLNIFDTTTTAIWLPGTSGVTPNGPYGGSIIAATFDVDAGHSLLNLTAGALDLEVWYAVPKI